MAATRRHTCKVTVSGCLCDKQDTTSSNTRSTTRCLQPRLQHHCIRGGQKTGITLYQNVLSVTNLLSLSHTAYKQCTILYAVCDMCT